MAKSGAGGNKNERYYTEAPDLYRYEMSGLDWIYGEPIPPGTLTPAEQAPAVYRKDDGEVLTVALGWWRNWLAITGGSESQMNDKFL